MTTIKEDAKLLTADDLLRLYSEGVRGELIRGVLHKTMPSGGQHAKIAANLTILLGSYVKFNRLGELAVTDAGVRLERDPDTVREPDIAFFSADKWPPGVEIPGYLEIIPDLVVEIMSPSDRRSQIRSKAQMWLSYEVPLVRVVYPNTRTVDTYQSDSPVVTLGEDDTLDGSPVLPGFTCPVRDIFDL